MTQNETQTQTQTQTSRESESGSGSGSGSGFPAAARKVQLRLIPLFILYVTCFLDRENIGFASLAMNADLGLSASAYGLGAGMLFWTCFAPCEAGCGNRGPNGSSAAQGVSALAGSSTVFSTSRHANLWPECRTQ